MKVESVNKQSARLTVAGALLLLSLAVFVVLLLPALPKHKRAPRVKCTATLKQVALGFALWANEHEMRLPMEVPTAAGGSREHALAGKLLPNIKIAANQIGNPRVLTCPSEKNRKPAETFAKLTSANISYFLNADATYLNQAQIIAGDRDVTLGGSLASPGLLPIPDPSLVDWGSVLHDRGGNVALVDGSVHQVTRTQFRKLLEIGSTNRLIIP
jgi:prepilin-type processing-associated H-X9-DG protein